MGTVLVGGGWRHIRLWVVKDMMVLGGDRLNIPDGEEDIDLVVVVVTY